MILLFNTYSFCFPGACVGDVIYIRLRGAPSLSRTVATSFVACHANSIQVRLPINSLFSSLFINFHPSFDNQCDHPDRTDITSPPLGTISSHSRKLKTSFNDSVQLLVSSGCSPGEVEGLDSTESSMHSEILIPGRQGVM
jgi:hypothetical protein